MKKSAKLLILISMIILNIFTIVGCTKAKASSKNDSVEKSKFKTIESRKDYIELIRDFETKSQQVIKNYDGVTYKLNSYILSGDNVFIGFFDKNNKEIPFLYINFDRKNDFIKVELKSNPIKRAEKGENISEEKENLFYELINICFNDLVSKQEVQAKLDKVRNDNDKNIKYRVTTNNKSKIEIGYDQGKLTSLYYNFAEEVKCKNEELINDTLIKGQENTIDNYINNKLKKITQLVGGKDSDIKVTLNDPLLENEVEKRRYDFLKNNYLGYEYKLLKLNVNNKEFIQNIVDFNFVVDKGQKFDYDKSILNQSIKILYDDEINTLISENIKKINSGEIKNVDGMDNRYKTEVCNSNLNTIINVYVTRYDNNDSYRIVIENGYVVK